MSKSKSGFTIVELLIVIVVIAILAAVTVVAYNGVKTRAQASAIVSDLKATEKALHAYKISTGSSVWWVDPDSTSLTGWSNPSIGSLIANVPTFSDYLKSAPSTSGINANGAWFYDNDEDTYNGCSGSTTGVSIAILTTSSSDVLQQIDSAVDDGNLSCGKVRYGSGYLLYGIANNSAS